MSQNVVTTIDDKIATITVDRPEKRNAMDLETRRQLLEAFESVNDDSSVRVVVLRGAGEGSFIAGGDIEYLSTADITEGWEYVTKYAQGLYNYVAELSKPTIAAIDGYALGGGLEISAACDIRLATPGAKLGVPEVKIGVIPGGGGTQRLAQIVGAGVAKELVLTGKSLDAGEAVDLGLVNHVYEPDEFDERVREMAEEIASNAPIAVEMAKKSVNRGLDQEQGLDFEKAAFAYVFGSEDKQEGMQAFLEDRPPEFTGK